MSVQPSRRTLLSSLVTGLTVLLAGTTALAQDTVKFLERGFLQRLRGECATQEPKDSNCWTYAGSQVTIEISRAPELSKAGGAIRLEGKGIPNRVLVVHGDDNQFHAFANACTHAGRRLDPVPDTRTVQCCSVGKSTFDYAGKVLYGPAKQPLKHFAVAVENERLVVSLT